MELKREFQNPKVVAALLIFVLIQLVIVAVGNPAQTMVDARNYVKLAVHAVEAGHLYPTYPDLYGDYLFAPGYVNYLAMWFGAGFSERAPIVVNILFNLGIVVEIFYLGAKAFNRKVGYLAACFFMLSLSTYASVLALLTEQMFTVLAGAGLCLALTNDKRKMVLAGIIIALANWIRPLGILYLATIVLFCAGKLIPWGRLKQLLSGFVVTIVIIGSMTCAASGIFAFQSSTFGVNLIMAANDYSQGNTGTGHKIFQEGEAGDVSGREMTFKEKDVYWRNLAIEWIKEHPARYFGMTPSKFARLYGTDIGFLDVFTGKDGTIQNPAYMKSLLKDFPRLNLLQLLVLIHSILYLLVFLLALCSAVLCLKKRKKLAACYVGLWLMGTLATLPFPCAARYHYPYMMIMFVLAAALLYSLAYRKGEKQWERA